MVRICPRCGNSVDDDLILCHKCGKKMADVEQTEQLNSADARKGGGLMGKIMGFIGWYLKVFILILILMALTTAMPQYANIVAIIFFLIILSPYYLSWIFGFINMIQKKR